MGTNYYAIHNACENCGRRDVIHIGKQSAGWRFTWHACRFDSDGIAIASARQWVAFLRSAGVKIVDEYGREWTVDEFLARIERHGRADNGGFTDNDGNNMLYGDFS